MAKQIAASATKIGPLTKLKDYLLDVRGEIDKVTWPSREDLKAHTLVVLFFLALLAVIVGAMDATFQRAILTLFSFI